jgi:hypothetical protein
VIARGRENPRRRARWESVARPALERGDIRFLQRVLGERDVAERARERRDGASGVVPEAPRDAVG